MFLHVALTEPVWWLFSNNTSRTIARIFCSVTRMHDGTSGGTCVDKPSAPYLMHPQHPSPLLIPALGTSSRSTLPTPKPPHPSPRPPHLSPLPGVSISSRARRSASAVAVRPRGSPRNAMAFSTSRRDRYRDRWNSTFAVSLKSVVWKSWLFPRVQSSFRTRC